MRSMPLIPILAFAAVGFGLTGCNNDDDDTPAAQTPATVVDVVVARSDLSTLKNAVVAQGLVPTLSGAGPFTVFAPTNAAFTAFGTLPTGTALTNTLTFHVLPANVKAADALAVAAGAGEATTVQGAKFYVDKVGSDLYVNQAKVTETNLIANNGTVHVINAVLTVPTTIYDTLTTYGLTTLKGAIDTAGLDTALKGTGTFTVFAPTNAAFSALSSIPTGTALGNVLKYHVLTSTVKASAAITVATTASPGNQVGTLLGSDKKITLTVVGGGLRVNDVPVTSFNIRATNGVVHVIGTVLTPPASG
jgi:transforming growth factor-beta-induced protein